MSQRLAMLVVAALAVSTSLTQSASAESSERPNIILVMADDQGWGDTSYNGHEVLRTPNLDALAAAGLRFNRFYAAAPVCSPTRGSCLTGRHPFRYGVFFANVGHMPAEEVTLAELLRDAGYATGHFGKWHLGTLTTTDKDANRGGPGGAAHFSPPWQNGFDVCFSTESKVPTWDPLWRPKSAKGGTWWDPVDSPADTTPYGTAYWNERGDKVTDNTRGDDSRIIMDRATAFIQDAAAKERPFFAVIWFHAPHLPVVAGEKYTKPYAEHDKFRQHYWGCIAALDEQVGRLRHELRELGVADNTMLWYCADNGPEGGPSSPGSAKNLRGRKRSLFEGGVRVPGILEWPARIKAGRTTDVPAVTSDFLPTTLEVLGSKMPDDRPLDGISLVPLIDGQMRERPKPIGFQSGGQITLVDNRYKIVGSSAASRKGKKNKNRGRDGDAVRSSSPFMLFDLVADPSESTELAAEQPQIVSRMAAALRQWQDSCDASLRGADYAP